MCSRGDELYEDCETLDKLGVVMDTRAVWEVPQGSDGGPHVWDLTPQCAVVSFSARCPSPHRAIILQCREVSETLLQRDSGPVAASDVCFDGCGGSGCDHGGL